MTQQGELGECSLNFKEIKLNKILTSHVGSLPRSQEVVDFIFARENNQNDDEKSFDACMQRNVLSTVEKQKNSGIDIVSDGETSKISYATYVKDRYTGFSGDSPRNAPEDLKLFPGFLQRLADEGGTPQYARPMCTGEVKSKGQGELQKDITNLKNAMKAKGVERGFMNAASPGVISLFLQNDFYATRDAYLAALEDDKVEPNTIIDTENGILSFYGNKVRDSKPGGYGEISLNDAFKFSSNTGIVKVISESYGDEPRKFSDRLYNMGLNNKLGVSILGESNPRIPHPNDKNWNGLSLPGMAYGYGVLLSPLQILTFYNSVANNGEMVKPVVTRHSSSAINKTILNPLFFRYLIVESKK